MTADLEEENNMKTRVISGFAMVPFLALVYLGGYPLLALCIVIAAIGVREFYNGFQAMGINPCHALGYVSIAVLYVLNFVAPGNFQLICAWLAGSIMLSSLYMFKTTERTPMDAMATMVGIIYVVFFSYHVVLVDQDPKYSAFVWMILISAFCTDIFAYFSGYFFGKHKLCPHLSPKKTIEGAVGGTLGAVICCGLFGYFIEPSLWWHCVIMGFIAAILSQCGDLTASAYKRKMGIKDYGNLIPGHGGIMDRFDSVLFTAPVVYYYIALVLN